MGGEPVERNVHGKERVLNRQDAKSAKEEEG